MLPLVGELALRHAYDGLDMAPPDLSPAEAVGAPVGFGQHGAEISVNRGYRIGVRAEALELRMMTVAARFAAQDRAREKAFTPQGDQPLSVEVARMQGPEARRANLRPATR